MKIIGEFKSKNEMVKDDGFGADLYYLIILLVNKNNLEWHWVTRQLFQYQLHLPEEVNKPILEI